MCITISLFSALSVEVLMAIGNVGSVDDIELNLKPTQDRLIKLVDQYETKSSIFQGVA